MFGNIHYVPIQSMSFNFCNTTMVFSAERHILVKNLHELKDYRAERQTGEFQTEIGN